MATIVVCFGVCVLYWRWLCSFQSLLNAKINILSKWPKSNLRIVRRFNIQRQFIHLNWLWKIHTYDWKVVFNIISKHLYKHILYEIIFDRKSNCKQNYISNTVLRVQVSHKMRVTIFYSHLLPLCGQHVLDNIGNNSCNAWS